ncbi:MAG: hypothetical protein FJ041_01035, partial [Candidatus Cloacimonetes bacterium]|nr:hypothetical protein [Candidatus Cloacimonadota bacterium]
MKKHPYTHMLSHGMNEQRLKTKSVNYNKLLVIMVDFQEEINDDPLTTGNGKFQLVADPNYQITIGNAPHDKEYFEANLEALRYYYLAASHNCFSLEYDVYPKNQTAYTLPHPIRYYNPPDASSALFVSRVQEYFKTAFELADAIDPQIDFSAYSHFMIIHAGSDWQHDTKNDTPSDIPSFFIKVPQGKEAVVDNGTVLISYACNVPETISQDITTTEYDGVVYYTGYGALNGVLAHEFGHSMGLVDLYNTYNFYPMVGQFDIMDSGGSGLTPYGIDQNILVEGMLPCLPGAFSRMIMFEDYFQDNGLMLEIDN